MDPINRLNGIAELLRKRIAGDATAKGKAFAAKEAPASARQTGPAIAEALRQRIGLAIEGIAEDDPARRRKAMRLFVENVLTWQFGDALLNDPAFASLADDVQRTLEQEPGLVDELMAVVGVAKGR